MINFVKNKFLNVFLLFSICFIGVVYHTQQMKVLSSSEISKKKTLNQQNNNKINTIYQENKIKSSNIINSVNNRESYFENVSLKANSHNKVHSNIEMIPGGQSIGVKLNSVGVLVVGHHLILTEDGQKSPGEIAGIQIGDMIIKMNETNIEKMADVLPFIQQAGKNGAPIHITVKREGKYLNKILKPLKDKNQDSYRIGLYIRDSASGIGTMTFIDPKTLKYGALGHVISDSDTKKAIEVENGKILYSTVTSIDKGTDGSPGEKIAHFAAERGTIGDITTNSPYGIFGKVNEKINNGIYTKPIPIALSDEVKEGPAKILTVIHDNKVEAFDIQIISSIKQKFPSTKGLILKVTDQRLLKETGGIVQGMSGSPIIQNGKLIGAVTHVFVNDSTSGYGVHIEWMLNEAKLPIYDYSESEEKNKAS